jgi:hypothetical protein
MMATFERDSFVMCGFTIIIKVNKIIDILQTFFTNRAQAYIQLKNYELALDDCHKASKLKPEAIKPYIHMVS